jgi:hypothetical protein
MSTQEKEIVVNESALAMGLPYPVRLSSELLELIDPNPFLIGLGIKFSDRINTVLSILKGNLITKRNNLKETLPKDVIVIPITFVKGPYVKEETVLLRAEISDDGGAEEILLTAILEEE